MKEIIIVGGFSEVIELCERCKYKIIGIIDREKTNSDNKYRYLGPDTNGREIFNKYPTVPVVIAPDNPQIRDRLAAMYRNIGFKFESIISPNAIISPTAHIGEGCIVQSFCNVSSNTRIGNFVKMNTFSNVMHDCAIGDFTTIAPNAVLLGHVSVGRGAYIGANSTVIERNIIGENTVIGAGAVVNKDIQSNSVAVGIPAKVIKSVY